MGAVTLQCASFGAGEAGTRGKQPCTVERKTPPREAGGLFSDGDGNAYFFLSFGANSPGPLRAATSSK